MIDFHVHTGRIYQDREPLTIDALRVWMKEHGIARACIMAIENPEETHYYRTTEAVLADCAGTDDLIPFCNVDPRIGTAARIPDILKEYAAQGARGFGEIIVELWIDDPRLRTIYRACGELGFPVLIHMDFIRGRDHLRLPRLKGLLAEHPQTNYVLHASHFWAEMSGDAGEYECRNNKAGIGKPIAPGGAAMEILDEYPNAYADLSALSAFNTLMRFEDNGKEFLETYHEKLVFGTDNLEPGQSCPIVGYIREIGLTKKAFRTITWGNAEKLMGLK